MTNWTHKSITNVLTEKLFSLSLLFDNIGIRPERNHIKFHYYNSDCCKSSFYARNVTMKRQKSTTFSVNLKFIIGRSYPIYKQFCKNVLFLNKAFLEVLLEIGFIEETRIT